MPERKTIIRRTALTAYFIAAFLLFLFLLFPFDRIRTRLESEVRMRAPLDLSVSRMSPRFFNRFVLSDVVVSDRSGAVLFESQRVGMTVPFLSLLRAMPAIELKADAYGGEVLVKAQQGKDRASVFMDGHDLDVASYTLLRNLGVKVSGKMGGTVELNGDAGKGRIWIKGLASRELKIKGFAIPDLDFEQSWIEAEIKGDRLTLKKLEMDGKELKMRCAGDLVMRERGSLNLTVKIKPSERLAREQSALLSFLKNKDAEGFYQFSIGGTLSEPMPRL